MYIIYAGLQTKIIWSVDPLKENAMLELAAAIEEAPWHLEIE
jgi:hypothetical protein